MSRRRRIGRERYTVPQQRPRGEIATAVGGAAAVLVGALIMIWLLRPGTGPGTGGLLHRQPRASWLIVVTACAAAIAAAWTRRTHSRLARHRPAALATVMVLVVAAAVAGGMLWPGGLLRHVESPVEPEILPPDATPPVLTAVPGSTAPSGTTPPGPTGSP